MKKILLIFPFLLLTACVKSTKFGDCIGIDDPKLPTLQYKLSIYNLVIGTIFIEMIVPPILVLADQTYCPVGKKGQE